MRVHIYMIAPGHPTTHTHTHTDTHTQRHTHTHTHTHTHNPSHEVGPYMERYEIDCHDGLREGVGGLNILNDG